MYLLHVCTYQLTTLPVAYLQTEGIKFLDNFFYYTHLIYSRDIFIRYLLITLSKVVLKNVSHFKTILNHIGT